MGKPRSANEIALITKLIEGLSHGEKEFFNALPESQKREAIRLYLETIETGETKKYDLLWEADYSERPVTIETFLTDKYYMGELGKDLYPSWREELVKLFGEPNTINEVLVTGAIGIGKTTFAIAALARKLYEILCLKSPQRFYGMTESMSSIVFGLFNITMNRSDEVHRSNVIGALNSSPWFRWMATGNVEKIQPGERGAGTILHMPNNVKFAFGSRAIHALGSNLIGGMLDETNFSILAGDSQVLDLYRAVSRRIESRFPAIPGKGWKSPGLLILVSSSKGQDDFLENHIKERAGSGTTRVISKAVWEAKGHIEGLYCGDTFRVMIGNGEISTKVLENDEEVPADLEVIDVPVEHREQFVMNPDEALMDIAGRSISGGARKMVMVEKIKACIRKDIIYRNRKKLPARYHPFLVESVNLPLDGPEFIENFIIAKELVRCVNLHRKLYEPIVNPSQGRFIHLDPATSGQYGFGFAMGHVAGHKEVVRRDKHDHVEYKCKAPYIYMDIILNITHPAGKEIDLSKVQAFIMWLRKRGYPIERVTADSFQSVSTIQNLKKQYFDAEIFSVDRKPEPYAMFREAIQEERLLFYDYSVFTEQLEFLQRDIEGNAFHLPKKFKDTCDAVCGVVAQIMLSKSSLFSVVRPITPMPTRPYQEEITESDLIMPEVSYAENLTGIG